MKLIKNENGLSLIEVLISIVILSIIFISFMGFFPQMGMMNKQNGDKAQAVNTAKQLLINWENNSDVKAYLANPTTTVLPQYPQPDSGYYIFNTTEGNFNVKVKIKITPSKTSKLLNAHLTIVQLFNGKGNLVTETYGYIIR
jgi:prepilin-type N-terminal cleavage/methylation domain-containing protein